MHKIKDKALDTGILGIFHFLLSMSDSPLVCCFSIDKHIFLFAAKTDHCRQWVIVHCLAIILNLAVILLIQ